MNLSKKNILITGADGFIGSHLTELLARKPGKVKALCLYNSFNSWGWLEDLDCIDDVEVLTGDVRDPHYCKQITKGIDIVIHLAALIAIPYSYIAPASYIDTNIKGTLNICQAALENACERIIHISTSEVYGTAQYVPINEKHPLNPQSPYSASKIGADAIAMSYFNSFGLPLVIARPFNTYGPRQSARAVIPTIITQIASGEKVLNLGDLSPRRDFNYVEDICYGLIELAECDVVVGEVINIGSNCEITIREIVDIIKTIMNSDVEIIADNSRLRPERSEVLRLWCDNTKIQNLTGFVPKYTINEGLEKTAYWFTNPDNLKKYKSNIYNL